MRIKKARTIVDGDRIILIANMTWGGKMIPVGTKGTIYVRRYLHGEALALAIHFDKMPILQDNGMAFGVGVGLACPGWMTHFKGKR